MLTLPDEILVEIMMSFAFDVLWTSLTNLRAACRKLQALYSQGARPDPNRAQSLISYDGSGGAGRLNSGAAFLHALGPPDWVAFVVLLAPTQVLLVCR